MNKWNRLQENMVRNFHLWVSLWILLLLNLFMIYVFSRGFSIIAAIFFAVVAMAGTGLIKYWADNYTPWREDFITDKYNEKASELMEEVKPLCDDIFAREIERITDPVLESHRQDITKGLSWLWEEGDGFVCQVDKGIEETQAILQLLETLSEDKSSIVERLKEDLDLLLHLVEVIKLSKTQDFEDLEECLNSKADQLKLDMDKEKGFFYDYVFKLLVEQMKNYEDEEDIAEYFNVYKLGEQFSVIMGKSVEARLSGFEESLINELENFSADIVGKMQKNALQLLNTFNHLEELVDKIINESRSDSSLLVRRLTESRSKITQLKDQAQEILVTLAWQDILVERRWQDIVAKMFVIKDKVMANVGEDVINYMVNLLDDEIMDFNNISSNAETALIYKSLVDAEVIYQVYKGDNLPDIISDGVYVLLQFVRPLELLVNKGMRFTEEGIKKRKTVKENLKSEGYQPIFDRVIEKLEAGKPSLGKYIKDVYPKEFYNFCNNPYMKQKTYNLNQAAWMLFMALIEDETLSDDIYRLVGILLVISKMRNNHIQPLKSLPVPLTEEEELENMRFCCYQAVSIFISTKINGLVRFDLNF